MLPEGWKLTTVGDVCSIKNNLRLPISSEERDLIQGQFPYFGPTGILGYINHYKIDEEFVLIGEDGDHFLKFKDKEMTLLFSGKANVNNHAHIIANSEHCLAQWFHLFFVHRDITSFLTRQGAKRYKLTKAALEKLPLTLPPLPEQKKIAQILSTWDKAITATEQLIANSQKQKKALMQQLLTGKKRLLDDNGVRFSGEWEEYKLEEVFSFKKGKDLSKADLSEGGKNKCILYGELYTKYSEVIDVVHSRTNQEGGTLSVSGDILIPSSTTTSGIDLANATAILEDNVLLGGDINILRMKRKISASFFSHLLTHIKKHEIASRAQGITIIHLYSTDLKDIGVFIPTELIEQQKIAEVLSVADQEISALKQKLDALKQEKKALMQQLLTGQRRVLV